MQAALRGVHGAEKIEREVSGYYIAEELASTYSGMMIAIAQGKWAVFPRFTTDQLVQVLLMLAGNVYLPRFKKHPRGPKKPRPKRTPCVNGAHVYTAKLIGQRKPKVSSP